MKQPPMKLDENTFFHVNDITYYVNVKESLSCTRQQNTSKPSLFIIPQMAKWFQMTICFID